MSPASCKRERQSGRKDLRHNREQYRSVDVSTIPSATLPRSSIDAQSEDDRHDVESEEPSFQNLDHFRSDDKEE